MGDTPPSTPTPDRALALRRLRCLQTPQSPLRSEHRAWLSTPDVFKHLVKADHGRDDGSDYGACTIWNPFRQCYVFEPIYDEDPDLFDNYEVMLGRQEAKKKTMKGLEELCLWSEEELKYNEVNADAFHDKLLIPYDMELRENEYDDTLRSSFARACLKNWSNRHAVRKTKKELSELYKLRANLEEEIISQDYLVTAKEEDEYYERARKKLRF